jgi:hypothetical protein
VKIHHPSLPSLPAVVLAVLALAPLSSHAQSPDTAARVAACPSADTANATDAGRMAARARPVAGYGIAGLVAGVTAGLVVPVAIVHGAGEGGGDAAETGIVAGVAAAVIMPTAIAAGSASLPAAEDERLVGCTAEYRAAYAAAYAKHLRQRRLKAAGLGTTAGVVAGIGWLALVGASGS